MSRERRKSPRKRARLKVEYGDEDLSFASFTRDISVGGIFLVSNRLYDRGTRLHLHIIGSKFDFYSEGLVVRQLRVPANLRRIDPQGMGVRFISPGEILKQSLSRGARKMDTSALVLASVHDLQRVLMEQVAGGVLVVPVIDPPPAVATEVEFAVRLEFLAEPEDLRGTGRVVQVLDKYQGLSGRYAVLEVKDLETLRTKLESSLHAG
jgi:hypothetical protein